jgi:exopolyphosphatase / guanosine-5'-triphosphate,3'-diphosphate pyrophosphatase
MATSAVIGVHHGNLPRSSMRCACIDIGSNTTRLLVAEAAPGRLTEVLQQRAFTHLGRCLEADGCVPERIIDEVVAVVRAQRAAAESAGAAHLRVVATHAIRRAANREALVTALREGARVELVILSGADEARLAFLGATRTLEVEPAGRIAVVDVGGGSTEIAVGTVADGVSWWASFRLGSGHLADEYLRSDPPSAADLRAMGAHAAGVFGELEVPRPDAAVAVGGSAASLRRMVGPVLEPGALQRALQVLGEAPADHVAERYSLDPERVRLMPAGMLILAAATETLGCPLTIGRGGLREGVLLELAGGMIGGAP